MISGTFEYDSWYCFSLPLSNNSIIAIKTFFNTINQKSKGNEGKRNKNATFFFFTHFPFPFRGSSVPRILFFRALIPDLSSLMPIFIPHFLKSLPFQHWLPPPIFAIFWLIAGSVPRVIYFVFPHLYFYQFVFPVLSSSFLPFSLYVLFIYIADFIYKRIVPF